MSIYAVFEELEGLIRGKSLFVLCLSSGLGAFSIEELSVVNVRVLLLKLADLIIECFFLGLSGFDTASRVFVVINDLSSEFSKFLQLFKAWQVLVHVCLEVAELLPGLTECL